MKNFFYFLVGLGIVGYILYVAFLVVQIAFGLTEQTWDNLFWDIIIAGGLLISILVGYFTDDSPKDFSKGKVATNPRGFDEGTNQKVDITNSQAQNSSIKTHNLIIVASEHNCNIIEANLKGHPYAIDIFQETGNWYTNGETGPEWFTVTIKALSKHTSEIERAVRELTAKRGISIGNMYWG